LLSKSLTASDPYLTSLLHGDEGIRRGAQYGVNTDMTLLSRTNQSYDGVALAASPLKGWRPLPRQGLCSGRKVMVSHKIEDVEGIGPVIGGKLRACGIKDTDSFLAEAKTPKQRKTLAAKAGLTEKQLLKFANMVDLYRISGVGSEFAELLEAAGVDTVPELAQRNAEQLARKIAEVSAAKKLTRRVPGQSDVAKWITQAKSLPRALEY
jgi:predicted flap endonuclease-1-like 5' DNA nuclease